MVSFFLCNGKYTRDESSPSVFTNISNWQLLYQLILFFIDTNATIFLMHHHETEKKTDQNNQNGALSSFFASIIFLYYPVWKETKLLKQIL